MPTAVRVETAPTYFILPNKAENGGTRMGNMKNASKSSKASKASVAGKVGKASMAGKAGKVNEADGANGAAIKVKVSFGRQSGVSGVTTAQSKVDAVQPKMDAMRSKVDAAQRKADEKASAGKHEEYVSPCHLLTSHDVQLWRGFIPTLKEAVCEFSAIRDEIVWKVLHHELYALRVWSNTPSCQDKDWHDLVDYISKTSHIAKPIVAAVLINEDLVLDAMWNQIGKCKQCEQEALEVVTHNRLCFMDDEDEDAEKNGDAHGFSEDAPTNDGVNAADEEDGEETACHHQSKVVSAEVEISDEELVMEIADRTGICPKAVEEVLSTMHSIFTEIAKDVREDIDEINASGGLCCEHDGGCDNDDFDEED